MTGAEAVQTLKSLRDLDGVVGSFLIGESGSVISQDVPAYFGAALEELGPRAQRLGEVLKMTEGALNYCVIRYGEHKLTLRPVDRGLLTIVTDQKVNMPSLRMAANLIGRQLAEIVQQAPEAANEQTDPFAHAPPLTDPQPSPTPPDNTRGFSRGAPEASGARPHKPRAVYFRGKRVR